MVLIIYLQPRTIEYASMKPTEFDLRIIDLVSTFRKLRNEKQNNLAALLNFTQPEYSRIERGARALTLGQLRKICDYLGLNVADLISIAEGSLNRDSSQALSGKALNALQSAVWVEQRFNKIATTSRTEPEIHVLL